MNSISSLYIDNSLIKSLNEEIKRIKRKISNRFLIKDLNEAKHVVGMQVEQLLKSTLIIQAAYTREIIELIRQMNSVSV